MMEILTTICLFSLVLGLFIWNIPKTKYQPRLPNVVEYRKKPFKERPEILYKILECESMGDKEATNPHSTATGIFQILKGTEELCEKHIGVELDMTNVNDSWLCALWLYDRYGTQPWNASKHCWSN